ncbi:hypothetical protein [Archangium lipolyticum]|uniref:hypothetical protein n=1 Tax=Archangium lipolyticum TaxID=2970465 RepID=UPI00214A892B|nr:hypothetical protein [Archangium lipolyticum]
MASKDRVLGEVRRLASFDENGIAHRALLILMLALLPACGGCHKTDAERAAEERAKIEKRIRDSNTLVPYRALKLTLRAHGAEDQPEAVTALWEMVQETQKLPQRELTPEEARQAAATYLKLAIAFYRAKQTLREHDEDDYPLLWSKLELAKQTRPEPPLPGYDEGMEHLFEGLLLVLLDTVDQGNRLPMTDLTLYEFSRATPQPGWPALLRTVSRAGRGLSFMQARYHYASEEELTAYVTEVEALPEVDLRLLGQLSHGGATPERTREGLLAAGYFLRAWNRMQLKRDEPAADDVERGLKSLENLGIENELTWWGWAFVHYRREKYPEAAVSLDKLASSPYVDEPTRQELQASAEELRQHGKSLPIFRQHRAALILVRALVARAGGVEELLVTLLGEERARQVYEPVAWMDRVVQGLAAVKGEDVVREAGGVMDKALEAGNQGWSTLKEKLGNSGPP